jgi:hypothetical protein
MRAHSRDQRGMVTAELAFAWLFVAGFVILVAWVVALLLLLASCQATAGEVARQEARGDHAGAQLAIADAPAEAEVEIFRTGESVRVRVSLAARPWASWLPAVPLQTQAQVLVENR